MPALPAVAKVVRVDHHFSAATDPNIQIHNFFQYSGTLSTTDATTWLGNIVTAMQSYVPTNMANPFNLVKSELTDLSSTSSPQVQNSGAATGTRGTNGLTAGVALVLKYTISRRYRGGHPRIYLPGLLATDLTTVTQWQPTNVATVTGNFVTYLNACIANTNPAAIGTITHVNVSYFSGYTNVIAAGHRAKVVPNLRGTPLVDLIVNVSPNLTPGSQRRRNEQG